MVQSSTLGMSSKWISNELQNTCESSFLDCDFKLLQGYQFFIPVAFLYFTKKRHASGYPSLECDDMLCLGSVGIDFLPGICCYQYIFSGFFIMGDIDIIIMIRLQEGMKKLINFK